MKDILVSIVIPCYNNAGTLTEAVQSCVDQMYRNLEIIIINDGSTDGTEEIIDSLTKKFIHVKAYSQDNLGPSKARNFGASLATGTYIVFLDADDRFAPTFVKDCLEIFQKNIKVDIVYSRVEKFEAENGIWILPDYSLEAILFGNCFPISSMVSLEKFKTIGMFDENLQHAEDWEMWIRMTKSYPNAYKIEKTLLYYRKRYTKDSITDKNDVHNYSDNTHLYIYNKHYVK